MQKENTPPVLASPPHKEWDEGPSQQASPQHQLRARMAREAQQVQQQRQSSVPPVAPGSQSKQQQALLRRRAAAEWVEALTGVALPTASDAALRSALRDGALLCHLLNILRPGVVPKVQIARASQRCEQPCHFL